MKLTEILNQLLEEEKKKADRCLRIARRKFKCAAARTCDAWVVGGPLVDKKDETI